MPINTTIMPPTLVSLFVLMAHTLTQSQSSAKIVLLGVLFVMVQSQLNVRSVLLSEEQIISRKGTKTHV